MTPPEGNFAAGGDDVGLMGGLSTGEPSEESGDLTESVTVDPVDPEVDDPDQP